MKWHMLGLMGWAAVTLGTGCATMRPAPAPQRFAWVTGLKADAAERYKELHARCWPSVLARIKASHIQNYSIYLKEIEGRKFLFSYLEYTGTDFAADMKKMAADPETQRWWRETDPCQQPLPGAAARGEIWEDLEEVFHFGGDLLPGAPAKRYGMIAGVKPEKEAWYRTLHATPWRGVNAQIRGSHIRNYSIFLKEIGGKLYLFSYFEYTGKDFEGDMAAMAKDPTTQRWWQQTDACQLPLPDAAAKGRIWSGMEEVFSCDPSGRERT